MARGIMSMGLIILLMKNGLSLECSLGRKLYAAVAKVHTSSYSTLGLTCLAKHVFKKA